MPRWLQKLRSPVCFAPGCYWVDPERRSFLWIAANELPLHEDLIPFLMARSGPALDHFGRWVAPRRPFEWVLGMLECLSMSTQVREELWWRFGNAAGDPDPEIEARRQHLLELMLEANPRIRQQLVSEGRLTEARAVLRRVLALRQLSPSRDDDARIEACSDLATLERWLDRAVTAVSLADVLES